MRTLSGQYTVSCCSIPEEEQQSYGAVTVLSFTWYSTMAPLQSQKQKQKQANNHRSPPSESRGPPR